jgi:hypothetical protein
MSTGIGAVFYVEHTRHLFPKPGEATTQEEEDLVAAMVPVVYFLVLFSIIVHGLSIPALDAFYRYKKIPSIEESEPAEVRMLSVTEPLPPNARFDEKRNSIYAHNRFSRPVSMTQGPGPELYRWNTQVPDDTRRNNSVWNNPIRNNSVRADQVMSHPGRQDRARSLSSMRDSQATIGNSTPTQEPDYAQRLQTIRFAEKMNDMR